MSKFKIKPVRDSNTLRKFTFRIRDMYEKYTFDATAKARDVMEAKQKIKEKLIGWANMMIMYVKDELGNHYFGHNLITFKDENTIKDRNAYENMNDRCYSATTPQGYSIVETYVDNDNKIYIIAKRPEDYMIAEDYQVSDGTWKSSKNGFDSIGTAQDELKKTVKNITRIFDAGINAEEMAKKELEKIKAEIDRKEYELKSYEKYDMQYGSAKSTDKIKTKLQSELNELRRKYADLMSQWEYVLKDSLECDKDGENCAKIGAVLNGRINVDSDIKDIQPTQETGMDKIIYTMQSDVDKNLYFYIGKTYSMKEGNYSYQKFSMLGTSPEELKFDLKAHGWHQVDIGLAKVIDKARANIYEILKPVLSYVKINEVPDGYEIKYEKYLTGKSVRDILQKVGYEIDTVEPGRIVVRDSKIYAPIVDSDNIKLGKKYYYIGINGKRDKYFVPVKIEESTNSLIGTMYENGESRTATLALDNFKTLIKEDSVRISDKEPIDYNAQEAESILRRGVSAENSAIDEYEPWIMRLKELYNETGEEKYLNAAKAIEDIDNEEKKHVGEFSQALTNFSPEEGKLALEGMKEVKAEDKAEDKAVCDDSPKFKAGQKYKYKDETYTITGTKEVVADVHTGRKGLVYTIKNSVGFEFGVPVWQLEDFIKSNPNYKLVDSNIIDAKKQLWELNSVEGREQIAGTEEEAVKQYKQKHPNLQNEDITIKLIKQIEPWDYTSKLISENKDAKVNDDWYLKPEDKARFEKYMKRYEYGWDEIYDGINSRIKREGMKYEDAVDDVLEAMVRNQRLSDSKRVPTEEEIKAYMKKTGLGYVDAKRALEEDNNDFHEKMQHLQYDSANVPDNEIPKDILPLWEGVRKKYGDYKYNLFVSPLDGKVDLYRGYNQRIANGKEQTIEKLKYLLQYGGKVDSEPKDLVAGDVVEETTDPKKSKEMPKPEPIKDSFDENKLNTWLKALENANVGRKYRAQKGPKYIKIIETLTNGQDSSFAFVDYDGNIYKAAGWNAPAKGVRATLDNPPLEGAALYKRF